MIPGSNLLKQALRVISKQTISYYRATGRTVNAIGFEITTYAEPIEIKGSFQPVPRNLYVQYDLDLQKTYYLFYTLTDIQDLKRDVSGDQIVYNSQRFQCESNQAAWYTIDGWSAILCVLLQSENNAR